jgi:SAM-dependent methyltransferase
VKRNADFLKGDIIEVGSLNVNGGVRDIIPIKLGIDMRQGPEVDEVLDVVNLVERFGKESWDNVVSLDALEHMEKWDESIQAMWDVLKPGGVLILVMASYDKGYHGYPFDYWRIKGDNLVRMFENGNTILDHFDKAPALGVSVLKRGKIDFTIRPVPVKK